MLPECWTLATRRNSMDPGTLACDEGVAGKGKEELQIKVSCEEKNMMAVPVKEYGQRKKVAKKQERTCWYVKGGL